MSNRNGSDNGNMGPRALSPNDETLMFLQGAPTLALCRYDLDGPATPPVCFDALAFEASLSRTQSGRDSRIDQAADYFARLCGKPAGYKGYGEGGLLGEVVRHVKIFVPLPHKEYRGTTNYTEA
jgi:hypothetical protein